ncbi:MAG TPA: serine/threonine-protein kinase, partial [Polyangiaceae bacterium]|nr:serine/threonine-protein kinase [Polyangiaceae bacterium]
MTRSPFLNDPRSCRVDEHPEARRGEQMGENMETGQTIAGKYRLNQPLGTGGMASVWSATNVFTDREFAVKFLLPHVANTPEAAQRFLLEARVSARVNHPNIIEVFDVGQTEDGTLFLVMELLQGMSLEAGLRRQKPAMRVHEFLDVMVEVGRALAAAHKSGVIHRDLKPSNIFLHTDREGLVLSKVLDFGVSKFVDEDGIGALTMVGTILGSPLYMSPEQAVGAEDIDGRTDVFAFGAILFEALSGERAYAATNLNALIVAIATTQPKRLGDVAPHFSEPLRDLVDACMATDKTQRLASFDEVADRLETIAEALESSDARLPPRRRTLSEGTIVDDGRAKRDSHRPRALSGSGTSVPPHSLSASQASSFFGEGGGRRSLDGRDRAGEHRSRTTAWAAMAGGALVLSVLALVVAASRPRAGMHATSTAAASPPFAADRATAQTVTTSAAPIATDDRGSAAVPVIPVDDLPMAGAAGHAVASGKAGHLAVSASPGACAVFV